MIIDLYNPVYAITAHIHLLPPLGVEAIIGAKEVVEVKGVIVVMTPTIMTLTTPVTIMVTTEKPPSHHREYPNAHYPDSRQ